ncbi:MAG TPA: MogA/MoaB family molybdenum cofactor biosynthesis protein [Vicinamibacterales bacterium]|nr:MogA/MoaB family molybdenum cofactor biosynthesis protein [Vicinamibacterales bacterium]
MSVEEHKRSAPVSVRAFVLTVSDTRDERTDTSGAAIVRLLEQAGHTVVGRQIARDDPADVQRIVRHQLAEPDAQILITTGGTGIASRDTTYEALAALLQKRIDGFGELFRMLSYDEIGSAAMLSRACAGVAGGKILFVLPGSEHAVQLALTKLILPELGHLLREVSR